MIVAVVVDHNPEMCRVVKDSLEKQGIAVQGMAYDGAEALKVIRNVQPDFVVMDILLSRVDGIGLLERLRDEGMRQMRVFIMTGMNTADLVRRLNMLDISGFFLKPYDVGMMVRRILSVVDPERPVERATGEPGMMLTRRIARWLHLVAVPPHVKGYKYLLTAISMVVEDPEAIDAMMKFLYPVIAETYHTTVACVERNMRHAIELAWNRCRVEEMERIFGNTVDVNKDKPNNSEFIAMLADHIRLEGGY